METFDLDFFILTPGGRDEHIMRVVDGQVVIIPPARAEAGADGRTRYSPSVPTAA